MEGVLNIIDHEELFQLDVKNLNGIVQLEQDEFTEPNRRATEVVLYEWLGSKIAEQMAKCKL